MKRQSVCANSQSLLAVSHFKFKCLKGNFRGDEMILKDVVCGLSSRFRHSSSLIHFGIQLCRNRLKDFYRLVKDSHD